jgi:hypothetical protein
MHLTSGLPAFTSGPTQGPRFQPHCGLSHTLAPTVRSQAAPFGMVATEAFPSITELAREMREKLAADLTAGTGMPSATELAREMREKLAADLTAGTGMPSATELAREMREKLVGCTRQ